MTSDASTNLWVFGYGSLCWYPGFPVTKSHIGYVKHYVRRFWQGNTTHRGLPGKPGRVATLVPEEHGMTWGVAYEISDPKALEYLNLREVSLGGYATDLVEFYPQNSSTISSFPVLLYIATDSSKDWAGPAPLHDIASQILTSRGPTGHNVEYLLRLAEFMRENVPDGYDEHLSTLEILVRHEIKEKQLCLRTLMGETPQDKTPATLLQQLDDPLPDQEEKDNSQYSSQLSKNHLRCLSV